MISKSTELNAGLLENCALYVTAPAEPVQVANGCMSGSTIMPLHGPINVGGSMAQVFALSNMKSRRRVRCIVGRVERKTAVQE